MAAKASRSRLSDNGAERESAVPDAWAISSTGLVFALSSAGRMARSLASTPQAEQELVSIQLLYGNMFVRLASRAGRTCERCR